jgi:hypothetical protein
VLLDGESGIVAGDARVMAARLLKMTQVAAVCAVLEKLTGIERKG